MNDDKNVFDISVSPSGKLIAGRVLYSDKLVVVWDPWTRTILTEIKAERALKFIPSPGGHEDYILVVMEQCFVVWDHSRGTRVALLAGYSDIDRNAAGHWNADAPRVGRPGDEILTYGYVKTSGSRVPDRETP